MFPSLTTLHRVLLLWNIRTALCAIQFFINSTPDVCSYNSQSISFNGLGAFGGLCAYDPAVDKLYGCPAAESTCYTWKESCDGDSGNVPDASQILCMSGSASWCCSNAETCTQAQGQINVCNAKNFDNPIKDVSVSSANALESISLHASTSSGTTLPTSPTSTGTSFPTTPFSAVTYSIAIYSGTITTTSTPPPSKPSSSGTAKSGEKDPRSLSGGIIGGVIAGVLVAAVGLSTLAFYFGKRQRTKGARINEEYQLQTPPKRVIQNHVIPRTELHGVSSPQLGSVFE